MKVKLFTVKEIKRNKVLATYLTYHKNKIYSVYGIYITIYKKLSKKAINVREESNKVYCVNEDNFMPFYIPYKLVKEAEEEQNETR